MCAIRKASVNSSSVLFSFFPSSVSLSLPLSLDSVQRLCNRMYSAVHHWGDYNYGISQLHEPDETDIEFRTVVIAIELISQSGDHIAALYHVYGIRC